MARTSTLNRIDPARPFYAAVGGVDVAVAYARTGLSEAQTRLAKVDFEPKALVDGLQKEAKAVPSRVVSEIVSEISETVDDLNKQYVGLAARGRDLVGRIRRQQATQDLKANGKETVAKAKTTTTQARKTAAKTAGTAKTAASEAAATTKRAAKPGATRTKSSAKAAGTTVKKTATAAKKATTAAAAKTGTTGTETKAGS